jgi:DNA-binding response OmpR family regulator
MEPIPVLCIEDEQEMIDLVDMILTREGFQVVGAAGGMQGLQILSDMNPLPKLVLLDLMMPDLDGWEVYQRMKAEPTTKDIPVIIITARAQSIDKVLGLQIAKVDDYITKPFAPADLLRSVEKVLSRSS